MAIQFCWLVRHFGPGWNISTTIGQIAIQGFTDIRGAQTMKPTDFGHHLTFPVGQSFHFVYLNTCTTNGTPSASTVLVFSAIYQMLAY